MKLQLVLVYANVLVKCSALICLKNAPNIPAKNFHALTRLDENRAKCQVTKFIAVPFSKLPYHFRMTSIFSVLSQ